MLLKENDVIKGKAGTYQIQNKIGSESSFGAIYKALDNNGDPVGMWKTVHVPLQRGRAHPVQSLCHQDADSTHLLILRIPSVFLCFPQSDDGLCPCLLY